MSKLKILSTYLKFKFHPKFKSRQDFETWQHKQVVNFLARIVPKSSFYSKQFQGKSFEDWKNFPSINKTIMMANFDQLNTVGANKEEAFEIACASESDRNFSRMYKNIVVGLSSGTSGNRGLFLISKEESDFWTGAILAKALPDFITKKQKIAFFFRANSKLYETVKSKNLQFHYFDLLDTMKNHIQRLAELQPTIIISPPSMLREIAKSCDNGLKLNPKKIISVAEVLDPIDEKYLEAKFGQKIYQVYQCTEGFLGVSCNHGTIHLNEDVVAIQKEYLDEAKTKFMPIITDFHRTSQPIIRYKLNDILTEKKNPCECGSVFTALECIEGRMDDIFIFPAKNCGEDILIFPDFFRRAIISAHDQINAYQAAQLNKELVKIYLDCPETLFKQICDNISEHLVKIFIQMNCIHPKLEFIHSVPQPTTWVKMKRIVRQF